MNKLTLALSFLLPIWASAANTIGCVSNVDYDKDYFPDKVSPLFSKTWTMEYHNTYKILRNTHEGTSYLMYQCGSTPPASEDGKHDVTFAVPLQDGVTISTTTHINQLEQLGVRRQIKAIMGSDQNINSPCLKTLRDEGILEQIRDPTAAYPPATGADVADYIVDHPDILILQGGAPDPSSASVPRTLIISESKETGNREIFEWHKVFGALFNLEDLANKQFDAAADRFVCAKDNAKYISETVLAEKVKPTVLWASYYSGTWYVATCDPKNNYYCELADACYSTLLHKPLAEYTLTTAEFIEFGKNADVWIYTGFDWDSVIVNLDDYKNTISQQFASVKSESVYDVTASGDGPWFESRLGEFDVVLQDFCAAVKHTDEASQPHVRAYLRKVLPAGIEPKGDLGTCPLSSIDDPWVSRASSCKDESAAPTIGFVNFHVTLLFVIASSSLLF